MFQEGIHSAACSLWRQFLGDPTAGVFSNASTKLSNPEEKSVKSRSVDCASGAQMERQFVVDEANEVQTSCERLQHVEGREALSPFALAVITICRGKGHGVVDHEKARTCICCVHHPLHLRCFIHIEDCFCTKKMATSVALRSIAACI
eukprot:SAG31_NODE_1399_length_8500_cov_22.401857_4_plen_148_part_00